MLHLPLPFHLLLRHNEYKFHFISPFFNRLQHLKWINFLSRLSLAASSTLHGKKAERKTLRKINFSSLFCRREIMQLLCGHVRMNIASVNKRDSEGWLHLIVLLLNKRKINFLLLITQTECNSKLFRVFSGENGRPGRDNRCIVIIRGIESLWSAVTLTATITLRHWQ